MPNTYTRAYGYDWPPEMSKEFIGLLIGKKHRELAANGVTFKEPWEPMADAMKSLFGDKFKVSSWADMHIHDWVMNDFVVTWGCASCGKALLPGEPVYTPDGPTTIGALAEGDRIISATGYPATVEKVFDHMDHELYRVRFSDGTETVCDEGHLWTVRYWTRVKREGRRKSVFGYRTATLPVTVLAGWPDPKRRRASVPLTKPVEFAKRKLPTDPYVLGCLLGKDPHDKSIPDDYKFSSVDDRVDLLAGLMDTNGTVGKNGAVSFRTASETLRDDVRFILESLGASVTTGTRRTAYVLYVHGLGYRVLRRLFRLDRKRARLRPHRHDGYKSIVSVEKIRNRRKYPRHTRCITLSVLDEKGNRTDGLFPAGHFTVTHNSNDTGALVVVDWIVDPYDTTTLVGSTTKDALRIRTWESIERYFALLKANKEFYVPGKITQTGYAIVNDRNDDNDPLAQGAKAGIHGVALNDGGKLQGAHSRYVRLIIDELATIYNHEDIKTTIDNLQIAQDFKFAALANPASWSDPSSQYCIPVDGVASVDTSTGHWKSTFGAFVRHHDGYDSPCVKDPSLVPEFPYLTQKKHIDAALQRADGNPDAPQFWKMVRGFPVPSGTGTPTVLPEDVATRNRCGEPGPQFDPGDLVATCAGIDPAWSEGGDGACYARVYVRRDGFGKPYLDFTGGLRRMDIMASMMKEHPAVEQLRNQVIRIMREPFAATFKTSAVDASGNQGLGSDLVIYAGAYDLLQVNSSARASETPLRAYSNELVKETVMDRGCEAWVVLAEFCRAGMVRGLPPEALRALTTRRFATLKNSNDPLRPLRLEKKSDFKLRFKHSPDECDACALAALAVKERIGLLPFGNLLQRTPANAVLPNEKPTTMMVHTNVRQDGYASEDGFEFGGYDTDGVQ